MRPSWWGRGFTLSLVVGVALSGGSGACNVREDEFDCENAVAHLASCCPGFDAMSVDCTYDNACGTTYPALDPTQSACIRQLSCESLRALGVCDRAAHLAGSKTSMTSAPVCPSTPDDAAAPVQPVDATIGCASAADCAPGQVCCALSSATTGAFPVVVVCVNVECPSPSFQLCSASSECVPGRSCVPEPALANVMLCLSPDASTDALTDTPTDSPEPDSLADDSSAPPSEASLEAAAEGEASQGILADAGPDAPDAGDR